MDPDQEGYTPKADWGKLPPKEKKAKKPAEEKIVKMNNIKSKTARKKGEIHGKVGDRRISQMGRTPRFC
jgi:hypothetical protein